MDQPQLNVHSITVAHQPAPDGKGGMTTKKTLTYMVGNHGPFYHEYTPADGTAAKMQSDITAQVAELQSLHQLTS